MGSHETGKEGARILGAALAVAALTTAGGCQSAVSATTTHEGRSMKDDIAVLHFKRHSFAAFCYNTSGCTVLYNDRYQVRDAPEEIQAPPSGPNYRDAWSGVQIGISNFPAPAIVRWTSKDGCQHQAAVDIGEIFKEQRIFHRVPRQEIPDQWLNQDIEPDILLEINDRTLRVFMQAHVPTKHLQDPVKPLSDFRDDLIEVWSKTY